MASRLDAELEAILPEVIALRHDLHRHPEIRWEETWTSDSVAQFLAEADVPHTRGHARGTGIVATITGTQPGKTVALRSDMDALEIEEATGLPYASEIPERMHACGHDGHMANLCGTARLLHAHRGEFAGTVRCIFQPAEEQAAGGRLIVEEGLLDGVDAVFGLHCWPGLSVGRIGVKHGEAMASADFFRIEVIGKGCHGADPGAGVDPIVTASHIAIALQTVVSREINPWDAAVVTVAKIQAGHASNVIPESAVLEGTFRALSQSVRDHIFEAIPRIASGVAQANRAEARVSFDGEPYPFLFNNPETSTFADGIVHETFGDGALHKPRHPSMAAEDFAFYLEKVPGTFLFLGNDPEPGMKTPTLHSPRFNFNDDALPVGMKLFYSLATRFLERD
jgi:hippurate hydrolase